VGLACGSDPAIVLDSVEVGGCFDSVKNEIVGCAMFKEDCDYPSSGQISYKTAGEFSIHFEKCSTSQVILGHCFETGTGERADCAFGVDSCEIGERFTGRNYGGCSVEGMVLGNNFVPTQYGGCRNSQTQNIICALTKEDCIPNEEEWMTPSAVEIEREGGCRCHDVPVGMCNNKDGFGSTIDKCAMAPYECEPYSQEFVSARESLVNPLLDCRLCAYDTALTSGVEYSQKAGNDAELKELIEDEENKFEDGEIYGLAIGTLTTIMFILPFILVTLFLAYVLRSDRVGGTGPPKHPNFSNKKNGSTFVKLSQQPYNVYNVPAIS